MVELQQKQVEPICRVTVLQQTLHVISQFEERIQAEGKVVIWDTQFVLEKTAQS